MTVDSFRPDSIRPEATSGVRDLVNGILFYGIFGFGLLIPVVLPLYGYLSQ